MSQKGSSLQDLKNLREAVLAEEKAKTEALLHNLSQKTTSRNAEPIGEATAPLNPGDLSGGLSAATLVSASLESAPGVSNDAAVPERKIRARRGAPANQTEPALIIPLTPNIQERLQRNVENARWSQTEVVIELIRNFLHQGYPAIQFGEILVAREGTFRSFERNPLETFLKIVSGQGVFKVTVRRENPELQNWREYLQHHNASDPDRSASQLCLASLQSYLESVEDFQLDGWIKKIPEESFLVAPLDMTYT